MKRTHAAALGVVAIVVVAGAFLLALFDWNWLKGPLESRVAAATGRALVIAGPVNGEWRWRPFGPRLRLEGVRFANPEWADADALLTAEAVEIRVALLPLLAGRVHILDLGLLRPVVNLERSADGRATWQFDREQRDAGSAPRIDVLRVDEGRLRYRDALTAARLEASLVDLPGDDKEGLHFTVKGQLRGESVALNGKTASLLVLQDLSRRLPIEADGKIADTQVRVRGEIEGLLRFENATLRYAVSGPTLRRLAPIFGVPLVDTPPYAVSGLLTRDGNRWETSDLKGKVGASDIAGTVSVVTGGVKPALEARLTSTLLDLADLGPLIGRTPAVSATPATAAGRVLPSRSIDLSRIHELDAHVTLTAKRVVRAADFPFDDFNADFRLRDAQIVIDPLEFGMADGSLRARVTLDARQSVIASSVNGRLRDVRVAKIFPKQAAVGEAAGTLSGTIELRGRGNSVAALLGTADGRATLLLANGRVPSVVPALADLDGARVLASLLGKKPESVHCAAIDLRAQQGLVTPAVAVIETESTVLNLTGQAHLRDETLDLKIAQAPKNVSFLSVRTPILVTGMFANPRLAPDPAPLAARGAAALLLGLINPLAALFALLETGPGEDGRCPALQRAMPPQPAPAPAAARGEFPLAAIKAVP
ncbi:MAG: AsmA family protein [Burkholderiales bacterium]